MIEIEIIEKLGLPAGMLTLLYILFRQTLKSSSEQQTKSELRYEALTNRFIDSVNKMMLEQRIALQAMTDKLDAHMEQKDQFMEFIKENITR